MKRLVIVLLLAASMVVAAQESINLGLIPTPQEVCGVDSSRMVVLNKAKVKEMRSRDSMRDNRPNKEQSYSLIIKPGKITISYYSEEGRQYAYMTLAQLKQLHTEVPSMVINDWPAYRYRGWMDDISRGPVTHAKYRQKQWERLHALKYNYCNYYTEHTLYQTDYPDLAPAYAAECKPHPDEFTNLQLFAHAEKTLRIPFYQRMMDSKVNFNPATYYTYDFIMDRIIGAMRRNPTSPFFIINCDETEQLGTGRAKKLVDSLGTDEVYVQHINQCYDLIGHSHFFLHSNEYGEFDSTPYPRVAMWGDIVAKNPAMMKQLPEDMVYIMWAYEPLDSFESLIRPFKEQGNPFWVASSASHSSVMMPSPQRYVKNIANLYRDGWRGGAEGSMVTCWDDNGEALFDNCWNALYWAAEMSWNPLKTDDPEELRRREEQFNQNFERLFYGDTRPRQPQAAATPSNLEGVPDSFSSSSSPKLGEGDRPEGVGEECVYPLTNQLYTFGALATNPDIADWYVSSSLLEPLLNIYPSIVQRDHDKMEAILDKIWNDVDSAANPHVYYTFMRMVGSSEKLALQQAIHRQLTEGGYEEQCRNLSFGYLNHLAFLKSVYLRLWDQENGDYERYIVMNRYDDLGREVLELDRHVFFNVECGMRNDEFNGASTNSSFPMIALRTLYNDRPIYYTLDGSEPNSSSTKYEGPFPLERSATIKAISYNEYGEGVITEKYLLSHLAMGAKITLNTKYSDYKTIYSGGGEDALIDGLFGSNTTYADGHWQGYWGDSIDAVIDFGKPTEIREVSMRFMQNTFDWILAPWDIMLMVSDDGVNWTVQVNWPAFNFSPRETGMRLRTCTVPIFNGVTTRFLRVVVPPAGPLPDWHPAPGQPSYLFTDEIIIK